MGLISLAGPISNCLVLRLHMIGEGAQSSYKYVSAHLLSLGSYNNSMAK